MVIGLNVYRLVVFLFMIFFVIPYLYCLFKKQKFHRGGLFISGLKEQELIDIIIIPIKEIEKCPVEGIEKLVNIYIEISRESLIDAIEQYKKKANKT